MLRHFSIALIFASTLLVTASVRAEQANQVLEQAIEKMLQRRDELMKRVPEGRSEIQLSFAPLVKRVSDSVVNVYAERKVVQRSPFAGDPFFERFFGSPKQGRSRNQNSLGSGVIVSANGVVVTNHHVIKGADQVKIALADGREYSADIILKDEASDLAILKVQGDAKFQPVTIGDAEESEVGDLVLAVGNPFGVGQTVTSGIISALARSTRGVSDFGFFIQTDAAINPGNSGGALINMKGELIGINTAIYSRSGGSNGIGFAIPSNMVQVAIRSSETGDTLSRPWIGISFQGVSADIAESLGMARPEGVLVAGLVDGGPAQDAGIQIGDVVLAVNDNQIPHINALDYRLTTVGIGNVASFTILRRGKVLVRDIKLMVAPETVPANETPFPDRSVFAGAIVGNLSPALAQKARLPAGLEGVAVLRVARGSPAAANRLQRGDVIRYINEVPVNSVKDVMRLIRKLGRNWAVVVERGGREIVLQRNGNFFRQYPR